MRNDRNYDIPDDTDAELARTDFSSPGGTGDPNSAANVPDPNSPRERSGFVDTLERMLGHGSGREMTATDWWDGKQPHRDRRKNTEALEVANDDKHRDRLTVVKYGPVRPIALPGYGVSMALAVGKCLFYGWSFSDRNAWTPASGGTIMTLRDGLNGSIITQVQVAFGGHSTQFFATGVQVTNGLYLDGSTGLLANGSVFVAMPEGEYGSLPERY